MEKPLQGLNVEWRSIEDVTPCASNPRIITQAAIEKVAASIQTFGWRQPIVVDVAGEIVVGHTRRLAAMRLGLEQVPVHVADGLTAEQIRAYRMADNRTGEESRWDPGILECELVSLRGTGFDLALLGFDPVELPPSDQQFEPVAATDVRRLDRTSPLTCPNCGHSFSR